MVNKTVALSHTYVCLCTFLCTYINEYAFLHDYKHLEKSTEGYIPCGLLWNTSSCARGSEAKQTETSEFGAEKGLFQGRARRTGGSCSQKPNSLMAFGEKFL